MYRGRLKGSPQVWWILFLLLLTTYFCLVLPAAFTRHGKHLLSDPCTSETWFQNHSSAYYWPTSSLLPFHSFSQRNQYLTQWLNTHKVARLPLQFITDCTMSTYKNYGVKSHFIFIPIVLLLRKESESRSWCATSTKKGPFTAMLISCSRGNCLIDEPANQAVSRNITFPEVFTVTA